MKGAKGQSIKLLALSNQLSAFLVTEDTEDTESFEFWEIIHELHELHELV